MLRHDRSAPIWLFSFVDLAFLLLIAFTQVGPQTDRDVTDLVTLEIPRIQGPGSPLDATPDGAVWQLRVHPVPTPIDETALHAPFVLVEPGTDAQAARAQDLDQLAESLALLGRRGGGKPILAPHRDARAEDLLLAVSLLDETFGGPRSAAVRPARDSIDRTAHRNPQPTSPVAAPRTHAEAEADPPSDAAPPSPTDATPPAEGR